MYKKILELNAYLRFFRVTQLDELCMIKATFKPTFIDQF